MSQVAEPIAESTTAPQADTAPPPAPTEVAPPAPATEAAPASPVEQPAAEVPAAATESTTAEQNVLLVEWHDRIKEQREDVRSAQEKVDNLKERLKEASKDLDEETERLLAIIDEGDQPSLFGVGRKKADSEAPKPPDIITAPVAEPDAWRKATLAELGITTAGLVEKLALNGLETMGAICDYTNSGKRLIDIKGIGKGAAQKVDDAIEKYWTAHPQQKTAAEKQPEQGEVIDASFTVEVPLSDLGLNDVDLEDARRADLAEQIKANAAPATTILSLTDKENRFAAGEYVVIGRDDAKWTLLPVFEETAWLDRVKKYSDEGKDLAGNYAGGVITDADKAERKLTVAGDDDAIHLLCTTRIFSAKEIGMQPGGVVEMCHATIGTNAPYTQDQPMFQLNSTVGLQGESGVVQHVVVPAPAGYESNVYAMRPLMPANEEGAVDGDALMNRRVVLEENTYSIGPASGAILVRDGEKL
jgi:uncharacterized coiled-coil protein SlyX